MASKQTDKQLVLEYLREHQTVTPLEAFSKLGCYRLGARIYDLRREGHAITTTMVDGTDRNGDPMRFAMYTLLAEET